MNPVAPASWSAIVGPHMNLPHLWYSSDRSVCELLRCCVDFHFVFAMTCGSNVPCTLTSGTFFLVCLLPLIAGKVTRMARDLASASYAGVYLHVS